VTRVFHWSSRDSTAQTVPVDDIDSLPATGWTWIDIDDKSSETIGRVCVRFGIDPRLVSEAVATQSLALLDDHADLIHMIVSGFIPGPDGRLATTEADVFVGTDYLITLHAEPLPTLGWIQERLDHEEVLPAMSPMVLLAHLLLSGSRRYLPLIDELEARIDGLEELAVTADPRTITEVHALRRDVVLLHRALGPQYRLSEDLAESDHPLMDDDARRAVEKAASHQARVFEALESARVMLGSVLESYRGALADQTNEIVRLLTVFSAVLLPLGLVAGMWGMNFASVPGDEIESGFWWMVALMALFAFGLWLYFARRGFIGAPRLRELPKAVGLGLIQAGAVPIRAVAGGVESTMRFVGSPGAEKGPPPE
jgi:magnesium transporter